MEQKILELQKQIGELTAKNEAYAKEIETLKSDAEKSEADHAAAIKAANDAHEATKAEFTKKVEGLEKEKAETETKLAAHAKAASEAADRDRETFLDANAKKFPPALRAHFKAMLQESSKEGYAMKVDGSELKSEADVRKFIESMPESPLFAEFGKAKDKGQVATGDPIKDYDAKVKAYCKKNDLDPNDGAAYKQAVKALAAEESESGGDE